jgi:nitrogen regulatory protein P-II 1
MKEIKTVIQPGRQVRVREPFRRLRDFPGTTVSRAEGSGYRRDKPMAAGVKSELTDDSQKVRIEIVAPDEMVERMAAINRETCHTGQPGDVVVWVTSIESLYRMRQAP